MISHNFPNPQVTVLIYYWDDRDGSSFSGWWIGPKVGGDQVWSHADNRTSKRQRRFKRGCVFVDETLAVLDSCEHIPYIYI